MSLSAVYWTPIGKNGMQMEIALELHLSIKVGEVVDPPLRRHRQRGEQGDQQYQET